MEHEINLTEADVGLIVLMDVGTGRIDYLLPMVPQILEILSDVRRGQVVHLYPGEDPGSRHRTESEDPTRPRKA